MRITLIGEEVGSPTSGLSRFLINLAAGLRTEGVAVAVAATEIRSESESILRHMGVDVAATRPYRERNLSKCILLTTRSRAGRDAARLATARLPADWYTVVSDAAVDASAVLPPEQSVYLSNGDLGLMLLSDAFYSSHRLAKSILALGLARLVRHNASLARKYRVLLGNSEFTRGLMSFLYATPFTGVVYPPVDVNFFHPAPDVSSREGYVLAVARNSNEQGMRILAEVATKVPLHVLGGASVAGAQNLGVVSEDVLRAEYAHATFLLYPGVSELFGLAVAESLACATPVLAFKSGGPAEQIQDGVNGWLASTEREVVDRALSIFQTGVTAEMRTAARDSARRYSTTASAKSLLSALSG
jgi:glycosyltransferase involved in cell wall biosynthesis